MKKPALPPQLTDHPAEVLRAQWRESRPWILFTLVLSALATALFLVMTLYQGIDAQVLVRDITVMAGVRIQTGSISQLALFGWAGASSLAVFAALTYTGRWRAYFGLLSFLSVHLLLDDAFMLHETFYPRVGIPEWATFLAYGVAVGWIAARYLDLVCRSSMVLFALAIGLFVASTVVDLFGTLQSPGWYFGLEELLKFSGTIAWMVYLGHTAHLTARRDPEEAA